ncbi:SMI1/KNR4 family protein [Kitasatospora sp. NBC_01302]|uniref:SMI1/KNR4 family protein n=1 Tax=Kitasatospora sp. NBC_01302 TaxID=2903575 RepID=UPI002E0FD4D0|nr:SMI1/KNR4 family protein [Kitasatospora sp. NBC_01302]
MAHDSTDPTRHWDSASIHARVEAMAQADPARRRFGSDCHGYRLRPPLAEETIRSFERQHGVRLPGSYRAFLKEVADGGAGPDHGVLGLDEQVDEEDALHQLREEDRHAGFLAAPFPHTDAWPGPGREGSAKYSVQGSLVLGEQRCGTFSRLVVTGRNAGQVWTDDPVWGGLTPGPDFRAWYTAWLAVG